MGAGAVRLAGATSGRLLLVLLLVLAACAPAPSGEPVDELATITPTELEELLRTEPRPVIVNVWASWCIPCRSEAPLLREAHARHGEEVRFVGVDVQDTQAGARAFLEEFRITYDNFFDPGGEVPASLGGFGVPLTYFFTLGGELVHLEPGVIDERTLALQVDELLRRSG